MANPRSATEKPSPADGIRMLGILNSYAPDGKNAAQLIIYNDGTTKVFGEDSLARNTLGILLLAAIAGLKN